MRIILLNKCKIPSKEFGRKLKKVNKSYAWDSNPHHLYGIYMATRYAMRQVSGSVVTGLLMPLSDIP